MIGANAMRVKSQFYSTNGTLAVVTVLYKNDLDFINKRWPRLLDAVANEQNSVNRLHGLILIAEKLERRDEEIRTHNAQTRPQTQVHGVS